MSPGRIAAFLSCSLMFAQSQAAPQFRAGAVETDITPSKLPIITSGNFLARQTDNLDGTLHARAIALDDGQRRIVIAVADSLMIPRELADRVKYRAEQLTGIPASNILVSATHSHSAPPVMGALGTDDNPEYASMFEDRVVAAIAGAVKRLAPARAGFAKVADWDHTHNRRWIARSDKMLTDPFGQRTVRANMHPGYQNPDFVGPSGPVDPDLSVIAFQTTDGKPIALLANYSMHYIGGSKGVSADYFGYFCRQMQHLAGGSRDFVAIMSQGTSGDLHWMDYGKPRQQADMKVYAEEVAAKAFAAMKSIDYKDSLTVDARQATLTLSRRLPDKQRLDWAAEVLTRTQFQTPKNQPEVYAREQMYIAATPRRELILQALRIGDVAIAAIPNEVYAITGLKLKAQSPLAHTFNIELANGAEGYIPPPEQHKLGGYTTWPARTAGLEVEAEPKIVEMLLTLLEQVSGAKRRIPSEHRGLYAQSILAGKPLGYWRFSELRGSSAEDASGNGRHAELGDGVALYLPGPQSPGFSGDQINRSVHLAGGLVRASIPTAANYSVEMWIHNGFPTGVRPITGYLLSRGSDRLAIGEAGRLRFSSGQTVLEGATPVAVREWTHLVLVREGESVRVYINGKQNLTGKAPAASGTELLFGGSPEGESNFEGKLDEISVWGRPLSPKELSDRFRLTLPGKP